MAARWRIRHKLLLGLGLAAVLMTLLLGGTLRGLWSYYLTTNRIRARLAELLAAEKVNQTVGILVSDENIPALAHAPHFDTDPNVVEVRRAINACAKELEENLEDAFDPRPGEYGRDLLALMKRSVTALGQSIAERKKMGMASNGDDDETRKADRDFFKPRKPLTASQKDLPAHALPRHADDLRDRIKDELDACLTDTRRHYQLALWIVVPSSIVGVLLLLGLMWSFYSWILAPVRALEIGVRRVAGGDLAHRLALNSGDEMEELARAFNGMLDRLEGLYKDLARQVNERSRQLVRSERLASVGFLAAGVAHEINNPLASIAFCSEALEARLEEMRHGPRSHRGDEMDVFRKYLKMIQDEAFRCKSITGRLLEFSRSGEPKREMTEVRSLVQSVLDVTRHLPNHRGKQIVFEVPAERGKGPIAASINAEEIKSVILNLVVNGLESMEDGGKLVIRLSQKAGMAEVRFSDTGCGMTPEVLENIFEPFFTRSRTGKGTGLGLTISHLVVAQHGGEIEASSDGPGRGSTFTIRLPIQPAEAAPALGRAA